jgi:hypothetical protein
MVRRLLTVILVWALALPMSAAAGPIADSVAEQAKTAAQHPPTQSRVSTRAIIAGTALVATGFVVALYGFGNPTGPLPDPNERWIYPHRNAVGFAGIGIAAAGSILTWHGLQGMMRLSSVEVGPHRVRVQRRVVF